jgi:hypothetical protein
MRPRLFILCGCRGEDLQDLVSGTLLPGAGRGGRLGGHRRHPCYYRLHPEPPLRPCRGGGPPRGGRQPGKDHTGRHRRRVRLQAGPQHAGVHRACAPPSPKTRTLRVQPGRDVRRHQQAPCSGHGNEDRGRKGRQAQSDGMPHPLRHRGLWLLRYRRGLPGRSACRRTLSDRACGYRGFMRLHEQPGGRRNAGLRHSPGGLRTRKPDGHAGRKTGHGPVRDQAA